jgi:hypothetical protein
MRSRLLAAVAAACQLSAAGLAWADIATKARVETSLGHDTNPLRLSGDGSGEAFVELDAGASLVAAVGRGKLRIGGEAALRAHEADRRAADTEWAQLQLAGVLPRLSPRTRPLDLTVGAFHERRRSTFVDRGTGEIYRVVSEQDPQLSVPIGDRLDSNALGLFTDVRYKLTPRLSLTFDGEWRSTSYAEDYAATTVLDPLDADTLQLEPGVRMRIAGPLLVSASVVHATIDYEARPALDAEGQVVPGTTREDELVEGRLVVQFAPSERWRLRAGFDHSDRTDLWAGYYDSTATRESLTYDRRLGASHSLLLRASRRSLEYERLTVEQDGAGDIRTSDEDRLFGRLTTRVNESFEWFGEVGVDRAESTDDDFTHRRDWVRAGIVIEHR